jgi:hypothetical protein
MKFSRILWRRPRPKLGCGAKERKKERKKEAILIDQCKVLKLILSQNDKFKANQTQNVNICDMLPTL